MNDDRLAAAYARMVAAREPSTRARCASPEALRALVEKSGDEGERLLTLNHAMSCPACQRDLDLLRAVAAARPTPARRALPLAIAASLVLAVGISYARRGGPDSDRPDPLRSGDDITLVSPNGTVVDARPMSLVWRSVRGAAGYDVLLLAEDGTTIAQRSTQDTTLVLDSLSVLRRDMGYVWTVTARVAGARRQSTPMQFRLRAP